MALVTTNRPYSIPRLGTMMSGYSKLRSLSNKSERNKQNILNTGITEIKNSSLSNLLATHCNRSIYR